MSEADSSRTPPWLLAGRGIGPRMTWRLGTDGPLACLAATRESGETFIADESAGLCRVDRRGQVAVLTRLHAPLAALAWSDDGAHGAGISGENEVLRFDRQLRIVHKHSCPDACLAVAVAPYGHHVAVSLANGKTLIYGEEKRRLAEFETIRPLAFLTFCAAEPLLFAAAEHGLVCCHNFSGAEIWQQKNWSNVGKLCISGDGQALYMASFAHGVQTWDGDGASVGAYIVEGTVNRVAVSFEPQRLAVSTIERGLFWMDSDGEPLWQTSVDDDIVDLACDPLGEWMICGFAERGVCRLDWGSRPVGRSAPSRPK